MNAKMSDGYRRYTESLEEALERLYEVALKARAKGLDPSLKPESEVGKDLAELVEGLVGPAGVAVSIRSLSEKLPREELAFKIAEEIVHGKFGHLETQNAAEQAIRTALAILTEGITAAPLQGVAKVSIKENLDKTKYLAIYYAGPIRSAGGTDQALTLIIGDFVRRLLGLNRYKPTEEEINRFVEEMRLYERNVGRFQYHIADSQLRTAIASLPIEVTGTGSDPVEVQSYRNLPRIETNNVRGGALRVVNDGIVGRAVKVLTIVKKLGIEGWDWLKLVGEIEGIDGEKHGSSGFMEDIIAGRPVFSFPSQPGGFRLRYGRARNTGLAAVGVHPLTMMVLNKFLAGGTQIRIELPGKGGVVMPVDTIEPPVVLLKDGSVTRVSKENYPQVDGKIHRILSLGDLLISFGDFLYNNKKLPPSGYCEEWWSQDLQAAIDQKFKGNSGEAAIAIGISPQRLEELLSFPLHHKPDASETISMARNLDVPLHPRHSFLWSNITSEELKQLRLWLDNCETQRGEEEIIRIAGRIDPIVKKAMEKLFLPHRILKGRIIVEGDEAHILTICLGFNSKAKVDSTLSPLEIVNNLSSITIRAKAPTTIGARMGRPEKARRREMSPRVHILFPVGLAGGSQRNLIAAAHRGSVDVDLVKRRCSDCGKPTRKIKCSSCLADTFLEKICPRCGKNVEGDVCPVCQISTCSFERQRIDLKTEIDNACHRLEVNHPKSMKGVKGLSNKHKVAEILEKGILRAKEDLSVYKDGTIRFDATNAPLTHFKPLEVGISASKLKLLGYTVDCQGESLSSEEQLCELRVQDIVISRECAAYFVRVARFIDHLLKKVYGLPRYYNINQTEDLLGHLVIGLAPHTSVGALGRIIGFTRLNVCYAHPIWHSAKRRDCDGDEDALMLALDTLLNFSKSYLPSQIGGIMDAPLFIIPVINPKEVQRQAHEFDVASQYPAAFYEKTWAKVAPWKVTELIDLIAHKLGTEEQFEGFGYTIPVSDISLGNRQSMYKMLKKMTDKLNAQMELAEKISAVNAKKVALKVLTTHFLRDISGNLRAFTTQGFRCKTCNKRFRRIPLKGRCPRCGGYLSLTVYRGGIEKYLVVARRLVEKYKLPRYYLQRLDLVEEEVIILFEGNKPRQKSIADFA